MLQNLHSKLENSVYQITQYENNWVVPNHARRIELIKHDQLNLLFTMK